MHISYERCSDDRIGCGRCQRRHCWCTRRWRNRCEGRALSMSSRDRFYPFANQIWLGWEVPEASGGCQYSVSKSAIAKG